jgi:hypothetical protein
MNARTALMAPPPDKCEIVSQIDTVIKAVDRRARELEELWGLGRLPSLVPHELAERFRLQQRKFSTAVWEYKIEEVRKHGDAMLRAYAKLEEVAAAAGAQPAPAEQWEFETDDGLVVLVRDMADTGRAQLHGRKAQVWSLDEIISIVRAHPVLVAAKQCFPGATVESVRPALEVRDFDDQIPF